MSYLNRIKNNINGTDIDINAGLNVTGTTSLQVVSATTYVSGSTPLDVIIYNIVSATTIPIIFEVSGNTVLTEVNQKVIVDSASAVTITLPQITKDNVAITINNKNIGTETILPYSGQLINGDSSIIVERQHVSLDFVSYNFNWYIT